MFRIFDWYLGHGWNLRKEVKFESIYNNYFGFSSCVYIRWDYTHGAATSDK